MALLKAAGRSHIPVDPNQRVLDVGDDILSQFPVPEPHARPSIDSVINEIMQEQWYNDQIVDRRTFEAKPASTGKYFQLDLDLHKA